MGVGHWAPIISTEKHTVESMFFGEESAHPKNIIIGFVRVDFSKENLNKSIYTLLYQGLLIAFIFLSIGSLSILLLVKTLMKPFKNLTNKVQAMGEEGVLTQIPIETEDEVGELATAFNKMTDSLKEKEAEKQRLLEQLSQSQRLEAIGTLAGGIAHDFNNLLTIIQSNMELAKTKSPEYIQAYIEKTLSASKRGSDLVNRLLHFSFETPVDAKSLNIGLIAKEMINLLKNTIDSRINIKVDIEPDLWKAEGDAGQIQ